MGNLITHREKSEEVRLNKYLSESGYCSRREADRLIEQGRITVNGKIAVVGEKITARDIIAVDNRQITQNESFVYIALNKPPGITCTTDRSISGNIIDFVNYTKRIFPIGRLDKDSEGLILLTSDGDIVNKVLRAGNNHEKEYIVEVDKKLTPSFIEGMSKGVRILGITTNPCVVIKENNHTFRIILTQGLNRQIRRMCSVFGYNVVKLKRLRIMNIKLENLPLGKWRYLSDEELITLNNLIQSSIKTEEASK